MHSWLQQRGPSEDTSAWTTLQENLGTIHRMPPTWRWSAHEPLRSLFGSVPGLPTPDGCWENAGCPCSGHYIKTSRRGTWISPMHTHHDCPLDARVPSGGRKGEKVLLLLEQYEYSDLLLQISEEPLHMIPFINQGGTIQITRPLHYQ